MSNYPRILLIGAGSSISTKDVEQGFFYGLTNIGVDVKLFLLDKRMDIAASWLNHYYRGVNHHVKENKKQVRDETTQKQIPEPTWGDVLYQASVGALERALYFQVDAVVCVSAMYFHPDVLVLMRRANIPVFVLLTESPYEDEAQARLLPHITAAWTNERTSVDFLRQYNPNVFYMKHAYRPEIHKKYLEKDRRVRSHDVLIIGTGFPERIMMLSKINWEGIKLGLYGAWGFTKAEENHPLDKYAHQVFINNAAAVRYYAKAKIVLNLYRDSTGNAETTEEGMRRIDLAESMNPRAYELAATETFQISSYRKEAVEVFGSSVPFFTTPEELEHQIRSYLSNKACREEMTTLAKQQVTEDTFDNRAKQMMEQLTGVLNGN